jgi:CRISPR-associated protein Cas6
MLTNLVPERNKQTNSVLEQFLELEFKVSGSSLPADNGFSLYSAIKAIAGDLPEDMLLCSIPGKSEPPGLIKINDGSRLRLRAKASDTAYYQQALAGKILNIRNHQIKLINTSLKEIEPKSRLQARIVTFKLPGKWDYGNPPVDRFWHTCNKALEIIGITARLDFTRVSSLKIHDRSVLGFGVIASRLSEQDSITLQQKGLGGRKHFGAGWFF